MKSRYFNLQCITNQASRQVRPDWWRQVGSDIIQSMEAINNHYQDHWDMTDMIRVL